MTVRELIEELKRRDPEARVIVPAHGVGYCDINADSIQNERMAPDFHRRPGYSPPMGSGPHQTSWAAVGRDSERFNTPALLIWPKGEA